MSDETAANAAVTPQSNLPQTIVIQQPPERGRALSWVVGLLTVALLFSLLLNVVLLPSDDGGAVREEFDSGDATALDKIAIIEIAGTISPPFTDNLLKMIEKATDDEHVKGVVLAVDSPGGLVADSHLIYHRLTQLREKKPIYVAMKRMAASGGYYVSMGAGEEGRIFAEPTTWTGSIGVIIPRFDLTGLGEKIGVDSVPLKTGRFKDSLNPFRELSEEERELWMDMIGQSLDQFVDVIAANRANLSEEQVRALATGRVFTARDAVSNGLVDEIGFEEDAVAALQSRLELQRASVVRYKAPPTLLGLLLGSMEAQQPDHQWQTMMEATVPRAMYYCSWLPMGL